MALYHIVLPIDKSKFHDIKKPQLDQISDLFNLFAYDINLPKRYHVQVPKQVDVYNTTYIHMNIRYRPYRHLVAAIQLTMYHLA